MTERLLQFIWQFQHFNRTELETIAAEKLQVISPGQYNTNQGPDFTDAKVRIDTTTWAGSIELHLKTSDWTRHRHQHDRNYANVILHVVWENDSPANAIPVIELKDRVPKILLRRYEDWMRSSAFIACEQSIDTVKELVWQAWKDRLLAERLTRKIGAIEACLLETNHHWENTFWWLLARNFGMKVNADAFEAIARSLPLSILGRHKNQVHQLEALLFGQAGLLEADFQEDYPTLEKREYHFHRRKYGLHPVNIPVHFLRMRPGNFPSLRLAQLAMLIHQSDHLFSRLKESSSIEEVRSWLDVTANDYWHYHYRFDEASSFKEKRLGSAMTDNILINTIAPLLFAYGDYYEENKYKDRALQWIEQTRAERNTITDGFHRLGIGNNNARDSQALIELKNQYCDKKKCLDCAIGNTILKKE